MCFICGNTGAFELVITAIYLHVDGDANKRIFILNLSARIKKESIIIRCHAL